MTDVKTYFASIADAATDKLLHLSPPVPADQAPVGDSPQSSLAVAWQALAVHPMQVLETEYQADVRAAEAHAVSDNDRMQRQTDALSHYFIQTNAGPTLLEVDGDLANRFANDTLIENRLATLRAKLAFAQSLITTPSAAHSALTEMGSFVQKAADLLGKLIPEANQRGAMPPAFKIAVDYLGLFTSFDPAQAAQTWIIENQNVAGAEPLQALLKTLREKLMTPLEDAGNAVASVRALYNIKPFYLYRLLHRFHGGSITSPMDYDTKGKASGAVTEFMHVKKFTWLAAWHEARIGELKTQLDGLDRQLQSEFRQAESVIRFYVKGGRALFTALSDPAGGANDWDTGILIDPRLTPKQWYIAMAAVNDLVLLTLDKLRFRYTALLYEHLAELEGWNTQVLLQSTGPEWDEVSDYTRLGDLAEVGPLRAPSAANMRALLAAGPSQLLLGALAGDQPSLTGINGELIDIGISTRSSVELRELWRHLSIEMKPGVSGKTIPVPTLGYFIDDFATIMRESIEIGGVVDRKLAKRLQRLDLVLSSKDGALAEEVGRTFKLVKERLPKSWAALAPKADEPVDRLRVWTLAGLLGSIVGDNILARQTWTTAFDGYVADLMTAGRLYNVATTTPIWNQIEDFYTDHAQGLRAREYLVIHDAARSLAVTVTDGFSKQQQALGVSQLGSTNPAAVWAAVSGLIGQLARLADTPSSNALKFKITGNLAAHMQATHIQADEARLTEMWPVELIEVLVGVDSEHNAQPYLRQISNFLKGDHLRASLVGDGFDCRLLFVADRGFVNSTGLIHEAEPVVFSLRPVINQALSERPSDRVYGWPVATSRELVVGFTERAASALDFDIRKRLEGTLGVLVDDVLGRQI